MAIDRDFTHCGVSSASGHNADCAGKRNFSANGDLCVLSMKKS